ncbi:NAD-dependent epimerase/dehydratase family protein [Pseudomonadota bacterium]|nr:NAD-dependent epimerase/dehydratase family protein [Pseudomonadota bacterium]
MRKKILVTGSNGFVGRHVLKAFDYNNIELHVVVRKGTTLESSISKYVEKVIYTKNLFDESIEWWAEKCHGIEVVLHLAWYTEPGKYLNSDKNLDCLIGSYRIAQGAKIAKIKRFVGIGSCAEYDLTEGILSVSTSLDPKTLYGSTKVALYYVLRDWFKEASIEFAWCRLFFLHGEGEHHDRLLPYLERRLKAGESVDLSDGNQIRDFIDVKIAGQMISFIVCDKSFGPFNICSGIPKTVKEMVHEVADKYSRPDLLNFGARDDNLTDLPKILGVPNVY